MLVSCRAGWDLRSEAPVVWDDQPARECGGWGVSVGQGNRICKRVCKPDRAGRGEMGETHRTAGDLLPQVRLGQGGDQRICETAEMIVGCLITQRSQVQILPRY